MLKLSVSNIAWVAANDGEVFSAMKDLGFDGLEIAPTRVFPELPYDRCPEAGVFAKKIKKEYGFVIPSMQSIWYGRKENIFNGEEDRETLREYTKKAILFAKEIGCGNLVFGCPKNRIVPEGGDPKAANGFFKAIGDYAKANGTVVGMEANPTIYGTNFVNTNASALKLIEEVESDGFKLNLDVGTMIENGEDIAVLKGHAGLINHVHISEPNLVPVQKRKLHNELNEFLRQEGYEGFVSIEMKTTDDIDGLKRIMEYVVSVFGEK